MIKVLKIVGVLLLLSLYLIFIWFTFSRFVNTLPEHFGYVDTQENWRSLEDFTHLKVYFRDYFYGYGWFLLFLQSIPYLLLKGTYLGVLVARHIYLPLIGVILAYFVGKNILQKKSYIFLFMFFNLLYGSATDFSPVRHLVAEFGLSLFVLFLLKNKQKYLFFSGVISGLAVLTALEYGLAVNIVLLSFLIIYFFCKYRIKIYSLLSFIFGELIILLPFFSYLHLNGALKNYINFTLGLMNSFYYSSPCARDSFPRFTDISTLTPSSKLLIFGLPIEYLQNLNLYIVLFFYLFLLVVSVIRLIRERKLGKNSLGALILIFYGLLIYVRTVDTPCLGYFRYGLIPFFLLLVLTLGNIYNTYFRRKHLVSKITSIIIILFIIFWFILTENFGLITKIFGKKDSTTKKISHEFRFNSSVGWYIDNRFADEYQKVVNYILDNTTNKDYLYVYPWGPYNNMTKRRPPESVINPYQFMAGKQFEIRTLKELQTKNPKLVVINIYNNLGIAIFGRERKDILSFFALSSEDGPVFAGEGIEVERYILENYKTVFKNKLAIVMEKRKVPIKIEKRYKNVVKLSHWKNSNEHLQFMKNKGKDNEYKVSGKNAGWALMLDTPISASDIKIQLKLDGDIISKRLSRYLITASAYTEGESKLVGLNTEVARKELQTIHIPFEQNFAVSSVKISISDNRGLVWWLHPYALRIEDIVFLDKNKIDTTSKLEAEIK